MPFLLLLATLTFAFGAHAGLALRRLVRVGPGALLPLQFVIAIYGGYFGGAVGLMMMAIWSLLNASADLKAMAPARVLLVSSANAAAVLWFIAAGAVHWPETLAMLGASIVGRLSGRAADAVPAGAGRARLRCRPDRDGDHRVFCARDVNCAGGNKAAGSAVAPMRRHRRATARGGSNADSVSVGLVGHRYAADRHGRRCVPVVRLRRRQVLGCTDCE